MAKKTKNINKASLIVNTVSITLATLAVVLSIILWVKLDTLSDQQLNTDLVNSYKNNYTQAQLENLRKCVEKNESECPTDKYVNSSNWKKQIDSLLD